MCHSSLHPGTPQDIITQTESTYRGDRAERTLAPCPHVVITRGLGYRPGAQGAHVASRVTAAPLTTLGVSTNERSGSPPQATAACGANVIQPSACAEVAQTVNLQTPRDMKRCRKDRIFRSCKLTCGGCPPAAPPTPPALPSPPPPSPSPPPPSCLRIDRVARGSGLLVCFGVYESAGYYPLPARGIYTGCNRQPCYSNTWTATMASVQTLMHRCTPHMPLLLARAGRAPSPWCSWPRRCVDDATPTRTCTRPCPPVVQLWCDELQWNAGGASQRLTPAARLGLGSG